MLKVSNNNISLYIVGVPVIFLLYIGHVQIAQVPDRHEPDSEGEKNYRYVLKQFEASDYVGWIGLEYIPKGKTKEGLKWINEFGYSL